MGTSSKLASVDSAILACPLPQPVLWDSERGCREVQATPAQPPGREGVTTQLTPFSAGIWDVSATLPSHGSPCAGLSLTPPAGSDPRGALGRERPPLSLELSTWHQQALGCRKFPAWVPASLCTRLLPVRGRCPPHRCLASALSRLHGTCAQRPEHGGGRSRGQRRGVCLSKPSRAGLSASGLFAGCQGLWLYLWTPVLLSPPLCSPPGLPQAARLSHLCSQSTLAPAPAPLPSVSHEVPESASAHRSWPSHLSCSRAGSHPSITHLWPPQLEPRALHH